MIETVYFHKNNFESLLKGFSITLISVLGRFYVKTMMGDNGPNRRPSSRASIFSDDQYGTEDGRIPITEQKDSRMKHLAAKAEDWNEASVREGVYIASLIYMENKGNDSWGSKLNSSETVEAERGKVIGIQAECLRKSVDARDRYRAMELKNFKHAFVSPFGMMEMPMAINDGKEARHRIRVGTSGIVLYSTLNIMDGAAKEQILGQMKKHEIDAEHKLQEIYASRVPKPTFAYLRMNEFRMEFQNNALWSAQMNESLTRCIYVGPKGSSEEAGVYFICQVNLRPRRQIMRYARRSVDLEESGNWETARVRLFLNTVALRRDVLKDRRGISSQIPQCGMSYWMLEDRFAR